MKDISIYFKPGTHDYLQQPETIGEKIQVHTENYFPEIDKKSIAIIHCPEYRNSGRENSETEEHNAMMDCFCALNSGDTWNFPIYDLGIIKPGNTISDTYFALAQVITELVKHKVLPIVLGGSQDLTFAMYQGYQQLEQLVNLTQVDARFDLGSPEEHIHHNGYISRILMDRPCYLFNCSNIGIQMPYVRKSEMDLYEKLYFDVCRLGEFNADFKKAEPLLRNTDLMSIDMNSVRKADFQGDDNTPNGFYADQICQIAKYAGISDKLTGFGIFNLPQSTSNKANNQLLAEICWYFIDGYAQRKGDFPMGSKKDYTKFIVHQESQQNELVFYKSPRSDRWWMEVPYPGKEGAKYERHHLVPCNFEDYEAAMKNEMPDLWWKTYQKLS